MKKMYIILLILIGLTFNLNSINASTTTYERTEDNLRIPAKIDYQNQMKTSVLTTPSVNALEKVYDFADLLTTSQEQTIYEEVMNYINYTGMDMAIVTISNNPKDSKSSKSATQIYGEDFYDYNDFQISGLLFVIDMDYRNFWIITSGQCLLYYDDARIDNILDETEIYMQEGDYNQAITTFINKSRYHYSQGLSDVSSKYEITKDGKIVRKPPYLLFTIISLTVGGITVFIMSSKNKPVKLAITADDYLKSNDVHFTKEEDTFINSYTNRVYLPPPDNGGRGGHSSFSSGSSGQSHGGGGRRF